MSIGTILLRGWRKMCPHCGNGALFRHWTELHESCPVCRIRFLRNYGDAWAFLLLIDRGFFLFPLIAAIYFGLHDRSFTLFFVLALALLLVFIITTPNRYGTCVALDYLMRRRWPQRDDAFPPETV